MNSKASTDSTVPSLQLLRNPTFTEKGATILPSVCIYFFKSIYKWKYRVSLKIKGKRDISRKVRAKVGCCCFLIGTGNKIPR